MVAGMANVPKCNRDRLRTSKRFIERTYANGKLCEKKSVTAEIPKCYMALLATVKAHFNNVKNPATCNDHVFKPMLDTMRQTFGTQSVDSLPMALQKFSLQPRL